jgi:trimeric autotransporter adhesin
MGRSSLSILMVLVLCTLVNKSLAQVNLSSGLIAYYPCTGSMADSSGNNHDGIINNASLTSDRFGRSNSAYYVNGSKKGMTVPALGDYGATGITISLWVKTTKKASSMEIVSGKIGTLLINVYKPGNFLAAFDGTVGNNSVSNVSTSAVTTGNWVNLTATNDGSTTRIYVNGNLENSYPETLTTGGSDLVIANKNFMGSIDDIRIYNRAISAAEISAIYNFTW